MYWYVLVLDDTPTVVRFGAVRTRQRASVQELRVHESSLQGEVDVQQIRRRRTQPQGPSTGVPTVSSVVNKNEY